MNFKLSVLSAAVIAASTLSLANAQGGAGPAGGDGRSGTSTKGGERSTPNQDKGSKPMPSVESRAEVKAETLAAKAAASIPQGQQSTATQGKKPIKAGASENSRAEVKAEAAAANKAGTTPKGQESVKDQNKGGVKP